MGSFSIWHWLFVAAYLFVVCFPVARILRRLGYSGWFAVLAVVPLVNLVALWLLAFARWPRAAQTN